MNIHQLNVEQVSEIKKAQRHLDIAFTSDGFPVFNTCPHTLVDLSNTSDETSMYTISVKLPNGDFVTICNVPDPYSGKKDGCIDVRYYGSPEMQTKVLAMPGPARFVEGKLYSLIYSAKKE